MTPAERDTLVRSMTSQGLSQRSIGLAAGLTTEEVREHQKRLGVKACRQPLARWEPVRPPVCPAFHHLVRMQAPERQEGDPQPFLAASLGRRARGFTLIEVLLVLGVAALLMVIGFGVWQEVNLRRAVAEETKLIQAARANLETSLVRYGSNDFLGRGPGAPGNGLGTPATWGLNAPPCPQGWCNSFGGETFTGFLDCWAYSPSSPTPMRGNGLRFGVSGIPGRACVSLVMNLAGAEGGPAWIEALGYDEEGQWFTRSATRCRNGVAGCVEHGTRPPMGVCPTGPRQSVVMNPEDAAQICGDGETVELRLAYLPGARGVPR